MTVSVDTWEKVSYVGFALAAIFLLVAIILFVKFRIWALFGELSGKTAARQMEEIRKGNREIVGRWNKMEPASGGKSPTSMRKTQIIHETGELSVRRTDLLGENPAVGSRKGTEPLEQEEFSPILGAFSVKKNVVVVHAEEMPGE